METSLRFFRNTSRSLTSIMEIYNIHNVVTVSQLRCTVATEIRKNSHVSEPKVIDMLIFKAFEELKSIVDHSKQRHHIIGQYVVGRQGAGQELGTKDKSVSKFLQEQLFLKFVLVIIPLLK